MTNKIKVKLDNDFFEKSRSLDLEVYENSEFYDKYSLAANECSNRIFEVFHSYVKLFEGILGIISVSSILFSINYLYLIFSFLGALIGYIGNMLNSKLTYKENISSTRSNRLQDYIARLFITPSYAKEFRLFRGVSTLFKKYYSDSNTELREIMKEYGKKRAVLFFLTNVLVDFITDFIPLLYAGYLAFNKLLSLGNISALITGVNSLLNQFSLSLKSLSSFYDNSFYIDSLKYILDIESNVELTGNKRIIAEKNLLIKVQDVTFSYANSDEPVLSDVSFDIYKGQHIAIVGHNGSGKSTLVKLLLRLYDPDGGAIYINSCKYNEVLISELRDLFGVVFQDYQYYLCTIGENVLMRELNTKRDEELVWEALEKVGLADKIALLPNGLYTRLTKEFDDSGVYLSGGELQKLCIARAFAAKCKIIIFDEPSAFLDPLAEDMLYNNMFEVLKEHTVIYLSHRLSSVIKADMIYVLDKGRIIERGNHVSLLNQNGEYAKMFRLQAERYSE